MPVLGSLAHALEERLATIEPLRSTSRHWMGRRLSSESGCGAARARFTVLAWRPSRSRTESSSRPTAMPMEGVPWQTAMESPGHGSVEKSLDPNASEPCVPPKSPGPSPFCPQAVR